jgi:hypothetical protein
MYLPEQNSPVKMNFCSRGETVVWSYICDKIPVFTLELLVCNTSDKVTFQHR